MMMKTQKFDDVKKLLRNIYGNAISCRSSAPQASLKDQVEFYTNPETVLYFGTNATKSVMASDVDVLSQNDNPSRQWLVSDEIISTYLKTEELCLILAVNGSVTSGMVGAFDRSTGLGLYYSHDWFDKNTLEEQAAKAKTGEQFTHEFVEVVLPGTDTTTPQFKRSIIRMRNLLSDCRSHQLSTACGFSILLADASD